MGPDGWQRQPLSEICELVNGRGFKPHEWGETGYPIIRIQNLNGSTSFNFYDGDFNPKILVKPGELLFAWSGSRGTSFGPHIWNGPDAVLNYHTWKVLPINGTDKRFLHQMLRHITGEIEKSAHGASALVHTQKFAMEKRTILVPPLSEQSKIADILSTWDAAIETAEKLLANGETQRRALLAEFLDRRPWALKKLREIGQVRSAGVDKKTIEGERPVRLLNYLDVLRRDHIYAHELAHWVTAKPRQAIECDVRRGDIFFTPSSETRDDIGHSAVAMQDIPDAVYSYHVVRFRPVVEMDLNFRAYAFKSKHFYEQCYEFCEGSGQRYVIAQDYFRDFTVGFPPLDEQTKIGAILLANDQLIEEHRRDLDHLRSEKNALMQQLLTGKRRATI